MAARVSRQLRSADRPDRRRDEQAGEGLAAGALGRRVRRARGDFGLQPVLVGGRSPREVHAERIILGRARTPPHSALGSGLRNLVGILDGAALVLSPDTGPLHMTVALDRPVVSLIGYTNPKRIGPYRRFHDLMIDAYGEPGEDYRATMENRGRDAWRASPCATCSIASSAGARTTLPRSDPKS